MVAVVHSRSVSGIEAHDVTIEVHLAPGFPSFGIVGLPEAAVKESKHRVRSAIVNAGFKYPVKRVTINLAPADLPKNGAGLDLPMAMGILAASNQLFQTDLSAYEFIGELALSGDLREVKGVLPLIIAARKEKRELFLPIKNAVESALIPGLTVFGAKRLRDVVDHLNDYEKLQPVSVSPKTTQIQYSCISDIKGQAYAKRALEIAASGGHHLLLVGPPGSGKTMLASRLPGVLPQLRQNQALETASIYSVSHAGFEAKHWKRRPFRSPHHTSSQVAIVGGGRNPRPGEVSLAHNGILFLDEMPEFQRNVLEVLREPLESREVHISRAAGSAKFPAGFQLVAAMNPCPCGYLGDKEKICRCTQEQVQRYSGRLSGPLLDRIDLQLYMGRVPTKTLLQTNGPVEESSEEMQRRVERAHDVQWARSGRLNARLSPKVLQDVCKLNEPDRQLLETAIDKLYLSVRSVHRVLKVARTIADMEAKLHIETNHLSEALSYRLGDLLS